MVGPSPVQPHSTALPRPFPALVLQARSAFLDFLAGVLDLDPAERWTPRQALLHPFITGEAWTGFFQPQADPHTPAPPGEFPSDPMGIPEQSQYVGGSFSQIKVGAVCNCPKGVWQRHACCADSLKNCSVCNFFSQIKMGAGF